MIFCFFILIYIRFLNTLLLLMLIISKVFIDALITSIKIVTVMSGEIRLIRLENYVRLVRT